MIKSSKLSLKFSNTEKLNKIEDFINEYKRVSQIFVDIYWEEEKNFKFSPKEKTSQIDSWLSARAIQACGKQALGIVSGTKKKFEQRDYVYKKLLKDGLFEKANRLKKKIDKNPISKPDLKNVSPELDSRFVKINLNKENSFDCWIKLSSLGKKIVLNIPLKRTSHLNRLLKYGCLKTGIRLSENSITFNLDIETPEKREEGETLGLDIGINKVFVTSNKQFGKTDIHGYDLNRILEKMSRRKKGSKGFKEAQEHRKNHINWSLNQLNLDNVKMLKLEKIHDLRRSKSVNRFSSHWTYTDIKSKLEDLCKGLGVQVVYINPSYTSQRCSQCGWVTRSNRIKEAFCCVACGFTSDSDLNASLNISSDLPNVEEVLKSSDKTGFYWNALDREPIVPYAQKTYF